MHSLKSKLRLAIKEQRAIVGDTTSRWSRLTDAFILFVYSFLNIAVTASRDIHFAIVERVKYPENTNRVLKILTNWSSY